MVASAVCRILLLAFFSSGLSVIDGVFSTGVPDTDMVTSMANINNFIPDPTLTILPWLGTSTTIINEDAETTDIIALSSSLYTAGQDQSGTITSTDLVALSSSLYTAGQGQLETIIPSASSASTPSANYYFTTTSKMSSYFSTGIQPTPTTLSTTSEEPATSSPVSTEPPTVQLLPTFSSTGNDFPLSTSLNPTSSADFELSPTSTIIGNGSPNLNSLSTQSTMKPDTVMTSTISEQPEMNTMNLTIEVPTTFRNPDQTPTGQDEPFSPIPLWLWAVFIVSALFLLSFCIIALTILVYIRKCKLCRKKKSTGQRSIMQNRESRTELTKETDYFSSTSETLNSKNNNDLDPVKERSAVTFGEMSRWDSFRKSWSRRSSRKGISTFKPQLHAQEERKKKELEAAGGGANDSEKEPNCQDAKSVSSFKSAQESDIRQQDQQQSNYCQDTSPNGQPGYILEPKDTIPYSHRHIREPRRKHQSASAYPSYVSGANSTGVQSTSSHLNQQSYNSKPTKTRHQSIASCQQWHIPERNTTPGVRHQSASSIDGHTPVQETRLQSTSSYPGNQQWHIPEPSVTSGIQQLQSASNLDQQSCTPMQKIKHQYTSSYPENQQWHVPEPNATHGVQYQSASSNLNQQSHTPVQKIKHQYTSSYPGNQQWHILEPNATPGVQHQSASNIDQESHTPVQKTKHQYTSSYPGNQQWHIPEPNATLESQRQSTSSSLQFDQQSYTSEVTKSSHLSLISSNQHWHAPEEEPSTSIQNVTFQESENNNTEPTMLQAQYLRNHTSSPNVVSVAECNANAYVNPLFEMKDVHAGAGGGSSSSSSRSTGLSKYQSSKSILESSLDLSLYAK